MNLLKILCCGGVFLSIGIAQATDRVISGNVNYDVKIDHDIVQATPKNAKHTNQILIIDNTKGNQKNITIGNPHGLGKNHLEKKSDPCSQTNRSDCQNRNLAHLNSDKKQLPNSNFEQANLFHASFIGAILTNSLFNNANLQNANFTQAKLVNTQFSHANLAGARFVGANLTNADLSYANLAGADLMHANIRNISLENAILSGVRWVDGHICAPHSVGTCS